MLFHSSLFNIICFCSSSFLLLIKIHPTGCAISNEKILKKPSKITTAKSDWELCGEENMVYRTYGIDARQILRGTVKFSCETIPLLERLKLTDKQEIKGKIPTKWLGKGAVFLLAANAPYFPYLRRALHSIKSVFGREQKVIVYDLGGISNNTKMMDELRQVCGLEWRQFNYTMLPETVRDVEIFAWKILIIAEVLAEYDTVIYEDTSVNYLHKEPFNQFLEQIDQGAISPFQMPSETSYSQKFQTLKETYNFFPDHTNALDPAWSETTEEASLIIAHRSEYSRRILKWSVLCALTKECIDAVEPGTINCARYTFNPVILSTPRGYHYCHLYDQTILNLLNGNAEHEQQILAEQAKNSSKQSSFISRYDRRVPHPRYWLQKHFFVDKRKPLDPAINFVADVKCNGKKF